MNVFSIAAARGLACATTKNHSDIINQHYYAMSRQYKFHNKEGLYFISFAVVYWIDLFVRKVIMLLKAVWLK